MSNFERRLSVMQRRPGAAGTTAGASGPTTAVGSTATATAHEDATALGWQAAERVSHLVGVEPGTTVKIVVDASADAAVMEISWDADGVAVIRPL